MALEGAESWQSTAKEVKLLLAKRLLYAATEEAWVEAEALYSAWPSDGRAAVGRADVAFRTPRHPAQKSMDGGRKSVNDTGAKVLCQILL